jgi:hypothetical protein
MIHTMHHNPSMVLSSAALSDFPAIANPYHLVLPVLFIEAFPPITVDFNPKPTKKKGKLSEKFTI